MVEGEGRGEESDELENLGSAFFQIVESRRAPINEAEAAFELRAYVAVRQDLFLVSGVK